MSALLYHPLESPNHVRLLHLEPGTGSNPIVCKLSSVSLLESPVYEALSYTWGDENEPKKSILCNGTSISVMKNLEAALRQLRLPDTTRILWADAICINQRDIPERNTQVLHMSQIYSKAARVVIWLGIDTTESPCELEMLEKVAAARELRVKRYPPNERMPPEPKDLIEYGLPSLDSPAWKNITNFFNLPWFERVWVQQELGLAKEAVVVYGSNERDWNVVFAAAEFIEMTNIGQQIQCGGHGSALRMGSMRIKSTQSVDNVNPYFSILQGSRNSACKDPRDKIYGFLAVINEPGPKFTDVDYASPISDVYIKFAMFLIHKDKSLKILGSRLDISQQSVEGLPSWCTDWTAKCIIRQLTLPESVPRTGAGNTEACVTLINNRILAAKGLIVDVVADVGSQFRSFWVPAQELRIPQDWDAMAANCEPYPTGEPIYKAWWKTMMAASGRSRPINENFAEFTFFCWYNRFSKGGRAHPIPLKGVSETKVTSLAHTFIQAVATDSRETAFFTTQKGFMGTGHASVEVGDVVAVLHGGPTPYILRPTIKPELFSGFYHPSLPLITFEDEVYLFLGECYVHGIMNGEAIQSGDVPVQEIRIC